MNKHPAVCPPHWESSSNCICFEISIYWWFNKIKAKFGTVQIKLNGYKRIAIEVIARDEAKNDCNIPEIEITEQLPSGRRQVEQADVKIYFYPTDKLFPVRKKINFFPTDKLFPILKKYISIQQTNYFRSDKNIFLSGRKIISGAKKYLSGNGQIISVQTNYFCSDKYILDQV